MDHPWRFPAGGDICPGCSARHFPFCPPPPLPPHPFPYDLQPPPPPPPQYPAPFHPPPPPPSPPPYQAPFQPPQPMWGPPGPGPHPYELPGREGPHKRMRLGEASPFDPYDAAPPPPPPQPGRPPMEGERLLGLVREHGNYRLPASPLQWHGQPYPSDGFIYGGGRRYHPPYGQGSDFANFDHAGRLPPPALMHDRHNAFGPGFLPGRGPQESYFDGDQRNHQFYPEALPVAPPLPPLPQYVDTDKPYDSRAWHPEARAMSLPPEPPFPSHPDYRAIPPRPTANSSLFPVLSSSPATTALPHSAQTLHQAHLMANANCYDGHTDNEGAGTRSIYRPQSEKNLVDGGSTSACQVTIVNACDLFKQPLRSSRPDHIVIILRGLPGSGKSYLAKALRDLEVENGANAPRIHSMDDYFMIEVEKIEDSEGSKSSSGSKGRRQLTKKVIEYCYEPEMEETYRSSMLSAFNKTLEEGNFTFVIEIGL